LAPNVVEGPAVSLRSLTISLVTNLVPWKAESMSTKPDSFQSSQDNCSNPSGRVLFCSAPHQRTPASAGPMKTACRARSKETLQALRIQSEKDIMLSRSSWNSQFVESFVQGVKPMHELKWSQTEKTVARRAFHMALGRELENVILEAKSRAAKIDEPCGHQSGSKSVARF